MRSANKTSLSKIGEFGLIDLLSKLRKKGKDVIVGIGDDAAALKLRQNKILLLTTDMLIEGVHFTKKMGAKAIGHKILACNISDIAAMGGSPKWAVVSLGVPKDLKVSFIKEMYKAMNSLAKKFNISIVGGDIVRNNKITVNISLVGYTLKNRLILRSGAKKGDKIFVTGPLGRSLKTGKHLFFTPRIKESQFIIEKFKPTSMIDISDGLASDLGHILKKSRVGATICEDLIPRTKKSTLREALYDGEDYELIFTLSKKSSDRLKKITKGKFRFFYIGDITDKKEVLTLHKTNGRRQKLNIKGFAHF